MSHTGDCSGDRNLSTESSSTPTSLMSVGIGKYPIGSNISTALRAAPGIVDTDSLDSDAVEHVEAIECDATGLRERVVRFALGPIENPQSFGVRHEVKDQHGCSYGVRDVIG